jgi:hypothetical protein
MRSIPISSVGPQKTGSISTFLPTKCEAEAYNLPSQRQSYYIGQPKKVNDGSQKALNTFKLS